MINQFRQRAARSTEAGEHSLRRRARCWVAGAAMALMALSSPAVATTLELTVDGTIYTVERVYYSSGASSFLGQYGDQYQSWAWFSDDTTDNTLANALATQWEQGSTASIRFIYALDNNELYFSAFTGQVIQDDDTGTGNTAISAYAVQVDARAVPEIDGVVLGQGLLVLSAVGLWGLGRRRERAESMGGA
ncbi:hypothetical protein V6X63_10180 [Spiribacter sp. 221]|uniref:hypothetical protein n=1 Tax=Spiribacter onubensis TaxID=3122420 RepID=UPI00349FAB23